MARFGSDRPDTRFGLELEDLGSELERTEFKVFAGALRGDGVVKGINAGARELPRSELDALTELAKQHGAKGLVWAFVQHEEPGWRSPIAKFLSPAEIAGVDAQAERRPWRPAADRRRRNRRPLPRSSARCGSSSRGASSSSPQEHTTILWVVQFPMFAWRPEEQRWDAEHHPFTAPATAAGVPATAADLDDPSTLLSRSYDLVLDGIELGGGSIRNHRTDVQERIFELLGIDEQEAQARFGFLLDALRYGAPPHGGIAFGLDRLVALLAGRDNIRETIAFPKATSGADPLTGAPAPVDAVQLRELGLRLA